MREHLTEELISAYIDGEVTADEQALVEQTLAESAEHQQLYDELLSLRSDLRALPRFALPDDFHQRVLRQAERRSLAPSVSTSPAPASSSREPRDPFEFRLRTWQGIAVVAAGLAVVFLFALVLVSRRGGPLLRPSDDQIVDNGEGRDRPDNGDSQLVSLWDPPKLVLVIDLTITPDGQQKKVFENALANVGIPFDPSIKVDEDLEEVLLASRFIGDVEKVATQQEEAADDVEMVYVTGTGGQIDAVTFDLGGRPIGEVARLKYNLSVDPDKRNLFKRLRGAVQLADNDPRGARRLSFRFSLRSSSVGVLGTIQPPSMQLRLVPDEDSSANSTSLLQNREPSLGRTSKNAPQTSTPTDGDIAALDPATGEGDEFDALYEVLFILRNLRANAVDQE